MPENEKELKNCHECGLEAIDDCETQNIHIPADENSAPCCHCIRNTQRHKPKKVWGAHHLQGRPYSEPDFFDEQWTRDSQKNPIIEDITTPHERFLLQYLHGLMNGVKNDAKNDVK